jgi:hypothetical protein
MTPNALRGSYCFDFAEQHGFSVHIDVTADTKTTIELKLVSSIGTYATGRMEVIGGEGDVRAGIDRWGIALQIQSKEMRYSARLIPAEKCVLQVVEKGSGSGVCWCWQFPGPKVHTHKQLAILSMPTRDAKFRMGAFTQYGQLFDLKDWAVAQDGDFCSGLIAVRVGKWSHPNLASARANGTDDGLVINLNWNGNCRRSYLLVQAPTSEVTTPTKLGIQYFEPDEGHASWAAGLISRYGTGRPERLAASRRIVDSIRWARPSHFLLGDESKLQLNDFETATKEMLATLERFHSAIINGSFLHPLGNAVAIRPLVPAFVLFHILDYQSHLSDTARKQAAGFIADIAELFLRSDFYPHNYATRPPEFPYSSESFYRGMLNQNFNTDGYTLVGMAGCVLPQHPRSKVWRQHAVAQFQEQMKAYVWPSGAWEESHTYANHVKATLLPFIIAMRNAPEAIDLMQNDKFRQMCRFFALLLSPPDVMANGLRGIPAIGDHGYLHGSYSYLFGWLAAASQDDHDRDLYKWAWQATGMGGGSASEHMRMIDALLLPLRTTAAAPLPTPKLARLMNLTGYGASYRGGTIGGTDETLLVVRCGQSWGHYHPDQGSFWWWAGGRLICCDAGLGSGELKFAHCGHNVLGYPGRDPLQYLDRQEFHVDQCLLDENENVRIRCQIPIAAWGKHALEEMRIPSEAQPHVTRSFHYDGGHRLAIIDEPTKSPDELVLWSLHVSCKSARQIGEMQIEFEFENSSARLDLQLPVKPRSMQMETFGQTIAVFCTYQEETLKHHLRFIP